MKRLRFVKWIIILFFIVSQPAIADSKYKLSEKKTESWVKKITVKAPLKIPTEQLNGGIYYLLFDKQIKNDGNLSRYFHYAEKTLNNEGVERISQISVSFDPAYEELIFHSILIKRKNKNINKLDIKKFKLFQRESEMEYLIYDGSVTASIILEDVRVGDIIEYAYTIKGKNPALKNHYSCDLNINWGVPLKQLYFRLLWPKNKKINIQKLNNSHSIKKETDNSFDIYSILRTDIPAKITDSQTPDWYMPYEKVYISDMWSWKDVSDLMIGYYAIPKKNMNAVKTVANSIIKKSKSTEEKIINALHFVQEKIRYLGIESGSGSHIPSHPSTTLTRRFGDCKDKTYLLRCILNEMWIKSYPALINTKIKKGLKKHIPSARVFDHVILTLKNKNKIYWLDPTLSFQSKSLSNIHQPNYGYALVISEKTKSLTSMKNINDSSQSFTEEIFDLRKGINKPGKMKTNYIFKGSDAFYFRRLINNKSRKQIEKNYLDFETKRYTSPKRTKGLKINDNLKSNILKASEEYEIKGIWEYDEKNEAYSAHFYSTNINNYLNKPDTIKRTSPYSISYPLNNRHFTKVFLPESWKIKEESIELNNKFFSFKRVLKYDSKKFVLTIDNYLKTKTDHIDPEEIDIYLKKIDEINQYNEYYVFANYNLKSNISEDEVYYVASSGFSYSTIILIIIAVLVTLYFLYLFIKDHNRSIKRKTEYYPVSLFKFTLMNLLSCNLYLCYWSYRNWRFVKERDKHINAFSRGIFSVIFFLPFYQELRWNNKLRENDINISKTYFATLFILLLATIFAGYKVPLIISLCFLYYLPFVNIINRLNSDELILRNSTLKPGHFVIIPFTIFIYIILSGLFFKVVPGKTVIKGNELSGNDRVFLMNHRILDPENKILYFYSDSYGYVDNMGALITDKGVVSYKYDSKKEKIKIRKIKFENIKDVSKTEDFGNYSLIRVVGKSGHIIHIFVTSDSGQGSIFLDYLKKSREKQE